MCREQTERKTEEIKNNFPRWRKVNKKQNISFASGRLASSN